MARDASTPQEPRQTSQWSKRARRRTPSSQIEELARGAPSVERTSDRHLSPLTHGAGLGSRDLVRLMLEKGADVDGTPRDDDAPLLAAAEAGHTAMVKLLLEAGAEPNTASVGLNRTTALVDALQKGDGPTVHLLIDAGARVRAPDRYWGDAFRYAAPHPDLVRALTRLGEDLDAEDELRRLPVEQVIKFGVPESLEVMLAASPSVRCSRVPSLLDPERSRQTDPEITAAMADILARHCPGGRAASAPR